MTYVSLDFLGVLELTEVGDELDIGGFESGFRGGVLVGVSGCK